jgi:hypothetical protein
MMDTARTDARESVGLLLGASAASVALWYLPLAGVVAFPIRLFVTFVHEICHAGAALLTLGSPHAIELYADGSGLTTWAGGLRLVVQAAGYTVTPLVGAALLLLSGRRRSVRPALVGVGLALVVATLWLGDGLVVWAAGLALGPAIAAVGAVARPRVARFVLSFLAVQCILNALGDLHTLFFLSVARSGVPTDAHLMAEATGGLVPPAVWAVLWIGLALATLAVAVAGYFKLVVSASPKY